jgi:signal transduction histidine kinase
LRVRIALVVVLFYLTGAFVWWAYSLISLSREQYHAKLNNLSHESALVLIELEYSLKEADSDTLPDIYFFNKKIRQDTNAVNARFNGFNFKGFSLRFKRKETTPNLYYAVIQPSDYRIQAIEKEWKSRKRAYYSEAVFFLFLLLVGVIWMFRSTEKIIRLTNMQKNFMLSVTHELKTPVAAIKLIIQTLKKRVLPKEKQEELLENADLNSDRLNNLIESMMMATRLESRSFLPQMEHVNLKSLLNQTIRDVKHAMNSNASIQLDVPEDLSMTADGNALKIAFGNLIENAIKYADAAPEITISAIKSQDKIQLQFADKGQGIPEKERKNIFRKFYRIGNEETRKSKGTGLGLYIVRHILKLHKASISIQSNEPKGSIFYIIFPITT